jgi:serine/threonine-protein kinase
MRCLGEGGMGAVFLGYQEKEHRQVAIKVLPDHLAANQPILDRFYRESRSGASLNHPNIVRMIQTVGRDQTTGKHYLVLEYVDGPSAQVLLERYGQLQVGDAVHIILDIARALEHAHSRNIVHRDIKPGNILLTQSGLAKLADLGLAKRTDETSHLTAARQGFGTPYYMPYEQAMNAKYADARSDIYALGATLYHLLTGEVPFPGVNHLEIVDKKSVGLFPPARSLNNKVPVILDDIIEKMLARDPANRYQTVSELIVDLERSELSAAVPSFIDRDLAMMDPLVRQRITSPAQPTSPDLQLQKDATAAAPVELWIVRYRDRYGQWCKAKGTAEQIRRRLEEGKLSDDAQAARQPQGEYRPVAELPEFQASVQIQRRNKSANKQEQAAKQPVPVGEPVAASNFWLVAGVVMLYAIIGIAAVVLALLAG